MVLSKVHKELLDDFYPKGFKVAEGDGRFFHIMFVDIIGGGANKMGQRVPVFHKYFSKEWNVMKKTIEEHGIGVTGHAEYVVLYDPSEAKAEEAKAEEEAKARAEAKDRMAKARAAKAKAKPEPKPEAP